MIAAGSDPRNVEYVPRYVKPTLSMSLSAVVSPRKTMHPTTEELVRAHHRAELKTKIASVERERQHVREVEARDRLAVEKLLREKHDLMRKLGISTCSQDAALDDVNPADRSDPFTTLRSKMRRFTTSEDSTTNASSPRTSLTPRDMPTKELLSKAGLERLYPETALITTTLADGSWFRIPKSNPVSSTVPSVSLARPPVAAGGGAHLPLVAPTLPACSPRNACHPTDTAAQASVKNDKGALPDVVVKLPSISTIAPPTGGRSASLPSPRRPVL